MLANEEKMSELDEEPSQARRLASLVDRRSYLALSIPLEDVVDEAGLRLHRRRIRRLSTARLLAGGAFSFSAGLISSFAGACFFSASAAGFFSGLGAMDGWYVFRREMESR